MIKENYVNFETAKLLKEKGFDEKACNTCYKWNGNFCNNRKSMSGIDNEICYQSPTLQMVMKWLREVHHYYIQVMLDSWACGGHMGYYVVIQKTDSDFEMMLQDAVDEVFYQTYEEACEAAIKYCLENLI